MTGPSGRFRVLTPEYGTITALVAYAVFVLVVDVATTTLRTTLADVAPGVSAALLGGVLAAVLWLVLGLVVLVEARRQLADNPREFIAPEVVLAHLDGSRAGTARLLAAVLVSVAGALLVRLAAPEVRPALAAVFGLLSTLSDGGSTLDPLVLRWLVIFAVGAVCLAWGLDRVAIGLVREIQYRRRRRRSG